ncbi:hypothetical protein G8759_08020 [Spirosoma aureum]|uniref:Uncharacterized protein n=1 Tax=Spirosoma aureum TaxID=2692134 RepID=A0A6G9AJE0_9BACT|nr:hypothetical protein [Spirosoma aureum]QIP12570.1 hypothetical protein G8759_08020 [Spirosoma aureum]
MHYKLPERFADLMNGGKIGAIEETVFRIDGDLIAILFWTMTLQRLKHPSV